MLKIYKGKGFSSEYDWSGRRLPDREISRKYAYVTCAGCGSTHDVALEILISDGPKIPKGWCIAHGGECYCPACIKDLIEEDVKTFS